METKEADRGIVVAVDLDGTLVRGDTLVEVAAQLLRADPLALFRLPGWLVRGRAYFKRSVSERCAIDATVLPYNTALLSYLKREKDKGRRIVLATAADEHVARAVADHTGLFDEVLASDGTVNLSGSAKAEKLVERFGRRRFIYAGDSGRDVPVWRAAQSAIVVSNSAVLIRRAGAATQVLMVMPAARITWRLIVRQLRVYQWVKNVLVFVPLLAAHQVGDAAAIAATVIAFGAFSLTASSVYVLNDLFDLSADRRHTSKKLRPLASGDLPIQAGLALTPLLLLLAVLLASLLPVSFGLLLLGYWLLNAAYSLRLKRMVLVDVMVLSLVYSIRVLAGGAAAGIPVSAWLLALIMFFSISGALGKRYVELDQLSAGTKAGGRGYLVDDKRVVGQLGVTSGYLSVLVLALYINSTDVLALYVRPTVLWVVVMLYLYWLSRVWLLAYRGVLDDDPVLFVLRDKLSWLIVGLTVVLFILAI